MLPYSLEITSKVRPLRDFFIIIFFILLGLKMQISGLTSLSLSRMIPPIIFFCLFVLIAKPLIIMMLSGLLGYTKRTSFLTGGSLAQTSEFSLIIVALAVALGHIGNEILFIVTSLSIVTIAGSTYIIMYSNKIYPRISGALSIFERKKIREKKTTEKQFDTVLFGYNRIGFGLLKSLNKIRKKLVVVDFNPEVIKSLSKRGVSCIYGDADNSEFLDELPIDKLKMFISTVPEFETNMLIINKVRERNKDAILIVVADQIDDAFSLYDRGADYVITPHFLGGQYISEIIEKYKNEREKYLKEKAKHVKILKERQTEGHEHPKAEKKR